MWREEGAIMEPNCLSGLLYKYFVYFEFIHTINKTIFRNIKHSILCFSSEHSISVFYSHIKSIKLQEIIVTYSYILKWAGG